MAMAQGCDTSSTMPKRSTSSSPKTSQPSHRPQLSPSPPGLSKNNDAQPQRRNASPILNGNGDGSGSLKSKMLARSAQNNHSAGLPGTNKVNHDILSRMVTVSGTKATTAPIRVASMQDFRRSTDSFNTTPESLRYPRFRQPDQSSVLNGQDHSKWAAGNRTMSSENPLLKMVEQRMAARSSYTPAAADAASTKQDLPPPPKASPPAISDDNTSTLQASINKWARANKDLQRKCQTHETSSGWNIQTDVPLFQSSTHGSPSGRVPLSPEQIELLHELTASEWKAAGMRQNLASHAQQLSRKGCSLTPYLQQAPLPATSSACPGLTRCAVSAAEVDRLRKENLSIQLLRQMAIQDQMNKEQAYMNQRNLAASALVSLQTSTQEQNNQIQASACNQMKNMTAIETDSSIAFSKSSNSLRKRGSIGQDNDNSSYSQGTLSSRANSVASSMSSHKIHRSLSRNSARAALTRSTENLCMLSQMSMHSSKRNESFPSKLSVSCGSNVNLSGLMKNRSGSSSGYSQLSMAETQTSPKRRSPNKNWIKSLLSEQNSVDGAAATTQALNSRNGLVSLSHIQPPSAHVPEERVTATIPIKDESEEYALPSVEGLQNAKADTNPINLVKEALSSRGLKCETKSSMELEDGFFTKVTDMYDQEIVNAIRANDIVTLRQLHSKGKNLDCGNRYGETLIHLACRRSHRDLVSFLVNEAHVSLRVRDDVGRTPWHDACWRPKPNLDLLDLLLDMAPELLMLSDKRGHTPFDYARREHWAVLSDWLKSKEARKFSPAEAKFHEKFCDKT